MARKSLSPAPVLPSRAIVFLSHPALLQIVRESFRRGTHGADNATASASGRAGRSARSSARQIAAGAAPAVNPPDAPEPTHEAFAPPFTPAQEAAAVTAMLLEGFSKKSRQKRKDGDENDVSILTANPPSHACVLCARVLDCRREATPVLNTVVLLAEHGNRLCSRQRMRFVLLHAVLLRVPKDTRPARCCCPHYLPQYHLLHPEL